VRALARKGGGCGRISEWVRGCVGEWVGMHAWAWMWDFGAWPVDGEGGVGGGYRGIEGNYGKYGGGVVWNRGKGP
jgi:hypothetical protein